MGVVGSVSCSCGRSSAMQLEHFIACVQTRQSDDVMEHFNHNSVIRVWNRPDQTYLSVSGEENLRTFVGWWFDNLRTDDLVIGQSMEFASTRTAPATGFFVWNCPSTGFKNCSVVLVHSSNGDAIYRMHMVVDCVVAGGLPNGVFGTELDKIKVSLEPGTDTAVSTFQHHFATFGSGVTPVDGNKPCTVVTAKEQLKDFAVDANISVYDHTSGVHTLCDTPPKIEEYFRFLYTTFSNVEDLNAPIWAVDEARGGEHGVIFLAWQCPGSGYLGGTDTFVLNSDHQIIRQFVVDLKSDGT